jgi:hypothetical protein
MSRDRKSAYGHVAPYSYPGGGRVEFRAEVLQVSQLFLANSGVICLGHDRFLSDYFQFILSVINLPWTLHILEVVAMSSIKALQSTDRNQNNNTLFLISNFRRVLNIVCIFWVFPRRQIVISRRFGTICQFYLQGLGVEY